MCRKVIFLAVFIYCFYVLQKHCLLGMLKNCYGKKKKKKDIMLLVNCTSMRTLSLKDISLDLLSSVV